MPGVRAERRPRAATIQSLVSRSELVVGRRGLEPRTSALDRLERCAKARFRSRIC
jgi:hypothetical protein